MRRFWIQLLWPAWLVLLGAAAGVSAQAQLRDGGVDPRNLGKGEWIYSLNSATNQLGGYVLNVTNEPSLMSFLRGQGIRHIILKAGFGDQLFRGGRTGPQFTSNIVQLAHAYGLHIFGYNRSQGLHIAGEIAVADYVLSQGADGFVWDAEAEWESKQPWMGGNGPAKAWLMCGTVRAHWPTKFLAHAPFPIITRHETFPYKEFGYWCDAVMPQIYHFSTHNFRASTSVAIHWTDLNWAAWHNSLVGQSSVLGGNTVYWTNAIKPLAPIHDVYGFAFPHPTPSRDVTEFIDYLAADPFAVTPGGYQGASFFRADLHDAAQWINIGAGTCGYRTGVVNNIVIDDVNAMPAGTWTLQRVCSNNLFLPAYTGNGTDTNAFGTSYCTVGAGKGERYLQFTPRILAAGEYAVYQWYPYHAQASSAVRIVINGGAGATNLLVNQQTNSGHWNWLGRFPFVAGTNGYVRVTDAAAEPDKLVLADAVKWVFLTPLPKPSTSTAPTQPAPENARAARPEGVN